MIFGEYLTTPKVNLCVVERDIIIPLGGGVQVASMLFDKYDPKSLIKVDLHAQFCTPSEGFIEFLLFVDGRVEPAVRSFVRQAREETVTQVHVWWYVRDVPNANRHVEIRAANINHYTDVLMSGESYIEVTELRKL